MSTTIPTTLPAGTWRLTPETSVALTVKKLKVITVNATVALTNGTVEVGEDGSVTGVHATMDASSFASGNDKRDEHVRSDDFLATDQHGAIAFESSAVTGDRIDGQLTIKGQAYPVTLAVTDVAVDDTSGTFSASASIDRTAVGVAKMPALVIAKMVDVRIAGHATLQD